MKRTATGLLAGTALVFLASLALPDGGATGFLRAAAEAGTVGGLADWFAVTALFRHPLGVPVPHTALIPRQKDELATKLGEFVTGNFLTADAVAAQLVEARVVHRAAAQLAAPGTAHRVEQGARRGGVGGAGRARRGARDGVRPRAGPPRPGPPLLLPRARARSSPGRSRAACRSRSSTCCVHRARAHLEEHGEDLVPHVKRLLEVHWASLLRRHRQAGPPADQHGRADPARRGGRPGPRAPDRPRRGAGPARRRPALPPADHPRRRPAAARAGRGREGAAAGARPARRRPRLGAHVAGRVRGRPRRPAGRPGAGRGAAGARRPGPRGPAAGAAARGGPVRRRALRRHRRAAHPAHRRRLGRRDASARIEASVGRDLQFIRINGTVVGALAGVVLHLVAVLAS